MNGKWRNWIGVVAFALAVNAAPPAQAASRTFETQIQEKRKPEAHDYYLYLYLGGSESNEDTQILSHGTGQFSAGAGLGWRFHRMLAFELDASAQSTSYDLPAGIGRPDLGDDSLELSTMGIFGNVKFGLSRMKIQPFVGVGLGLGLVDVSVSNSRLWVPVPLETEISLLSQVLAGMDFRVSRRSYLGLEYREVFVHNKFDFAGEELDGGGRSLALVYRLGWGDPRKRGGNVPPIMNVPPAETAE